VKVALILLAVVAWYVFAMWMTRKFAEAKFIERCPHKSDFDNAFGTFCFLLFSPVVFPVLGAMYGFLWGCERLHWWVFGKDIWAVERRPESD
jgi:hypothetical protein